MIKTIEFHTTENIELDEHMNSFLSAMGDKIELIDIKYDVLLDTYHNIIMSFALVIYKEESDLDD